MHSGQITGILLMTLGGVVVVEGLLRRFSRYPHKKKPIKQVPELAELYRKDLSQTAASQPSKRFVKDLHDQSRPKSRQKHKKKVNSTKLKHNKAQRDNRGRFMRKSL